MTHECHHGSCSHEEHAHDHDNCCCCSEHHHCQCSCHSHCHKYSDELLALADEAWMEVIKDKIKEEIIKTSGKHITQIAQLVSKSNQKRWNSKLDEKKNHDEYESDLKDLILRKK